MQKTETHGAKLRLQVSGGDNRTFKIKSAAGRTIGHAVVGSLSGPGLLVSGAGDAADRIFQRILELPALRGLSGRLVLLHLDRLDDASNMAELDRLSACMRPITDSFFLSAVDLDEADAETAQTEALFEAVLRFCAQHGMDLSGERPASPIIRDYAS